MKNNVQLTSWQALKAGMASTGKVMLKSLLKPTNLVIAGVTAMIVVLHKTNEAVEEVREKADELSNTFNNNKSDIEGYKDKIEDLYKTINDSGSSLEEVTVARQTLMTVQDELIDKFGDEKETIDLVTQAIYGQSSALDELIQKQWQETKNEFNESDMWNDFANWQEGYSDNIDRMVHEMENAWGNIKMSTSDYFGGEYDGIIKRLEEAGWIYISSSETFIKGGYVEDLYEEILDIQTLVGDDMPNNFLKSLTDDANKLKDTLDDYEDIWDNYILNDKILADKDLKESWKEINDTYSKYQDAFTSGDEESKNKAIENYADILTKATKDVDDQSIIDFFNDMYPTLNAEVEKWTFKAKIIPEFHKTELLQGKTKSDILEMLQTDGFQSGEGVFNAILKSADEYGLVIGEDSEKIEQLLDLLVQWGILQDAISDTSKEDDVSDILGVSETIGLLNTQLKPTFDALKSAYQDIFTEDGFTLENVDLDMLNNVISVMNEMKEAGLGVDTSAFENLAKVLSDSSSSADEVQQAFNNVATSAVNSLNPALSQCSGEQYLLLQSMLESLGVMNSEAVMISSLGYSYAEYISAKEEAANAGLDLANATESEINAFVKEALESGTCGQALALLQLKKMLVNSTQINTVSDIQQIMNLASAAGMGAEVLTQLANAKSILSTVESGGTVSLASYEKALSDVESAKQSMLDWKPVAVDFSGISSGASKAGKEAADAFLEAFEKELEELDTLRSQGKITEKQYLDALRRLYLKYFRDKEKYLKEYAKYEHDYLDGKLYAIFYSNVE